MKLNSQSWDLTFSELSEKDGLVQSNKYYFSTDHKGFVWLGSDNGLLRFDGKVIKKFQNSAIDSTSLFENKITSECFEDEKKNLWFTSFGALNCYNRKSNTFKSYLIAQEIKDYHLFHAHETTLYLRIGLGEKGHLYLFDTGNKKFTKSIALSGNECIPIKNKLGLLEGILSIGLPDQPGLNYININNEDPIHVEFQVNTVGEEILFPMSSKAGYVDKNGISWIGLYDGIGKYNLGDSTGLVHSERENSIISDIGWVEDIIAFDQEHLLIGADNGLFLFNIDQGRFVHQFEASKDEIHSITLGGSNLLNLDYLGNLWISGNDQKVAFANINKNRFSKLKKTSGISFENIQEDKNGDIWCSSLDSGVFVFSPKNELKFHAKKLKNSHDQLYNPLPRVDFFLQDQNNDWWGNIGNYFFLWDKDNNEFKIDFSYFLGVASTNFDRVNYCYKLSNGKNIIAKGKEIFELELSKEKVEISPWFSLDAFELNLINIIFEDQKGNIYINDDYGKLLICRINNNYLTLIAEKSDFGILNAFQEDNERNKIWVTGTNGLGYFHSGTLEYKSADVTDFDVVFYDIILDDSQRLWLPSSNGLFRFIPESKEIHSFNTSDGLQSSVFTMNANIKSSKSGEIWVAGKNGINVFDPNQIEFLKDKPRAQLTNILVNDEDYLPEQNISEITSLEFPYTQNTLSFEFAALDYADPTRNEFVHQMVGLDESPVSNSNRGFTRYGNIPPGDYVFKLWATNSDLVINEEPLEVEISISPPYYQTWWFYLICLIAIASIIYCIFRYRIAQILKVERLRTRIASNLHDDVGGILSGLAMQTELLELTAEEEDKSKLRQIADMSRSAMSGMRDTVWAIDARKEKFEDLLDRIREHAEEVLIPKDIKYDIDIHYIPLTLILPPLIRQNLYLIFKEAITNVAKHSNGDLVKVDIKRTKSIFEMRIHDNGIVNGKSYKTTGLGMSNMNLRAEKLDGNLQIDTEAGYEIVLKIPSF